MDRTAKIRAATFEDQQARPIFICYRQLDGKRYARWIYAALTQALTGRGDNTPIYFDQVAPAEGDWTAIHRPALERASSVIVIVTPGLAVDLGRNDWVYKELEWWQEHRKTPPIIVDTTGEGERWVPTKLRSKWPDAQRVSLNPELWSNSSQKEQAEVRNLITEQVVGAIAGGRFSVVIEDLARVRRVNRWLSFLLIGLVGLLVVSLILALVAKRAQVTAQEARAAAESSARAAQAQRMKALRILEWVVAETMHLAPEFNDLQVTDERLRIIQGLVSQLAELGFRGEIEIDAQIATFCGDPSMVSKGIFRLAKDSLTISRCAAYPSPEYGLGIGDREASMIGDLVRSLSVPAGITIHIHTITTGVDPGPRQGTAADWNAAARRQTGIRITLQEAGQSTAGR